MHTAAFLRLELQADDFRFHRIKAKCLIALTAINLTLLTGSLMEYQLCLAILHLDNVLRVMNKLTGHKENIMNRLWLHPWQKSTVQHNF